MAIHLAKCNRPTGSTPAETRRLYEEFRAESDNAKGIAEAKRLAELKASAELAMLEGMRSKIRRDGGDPEWMTLAQLQTACTIIDRDREAKAKRDAADLARRRYERRADELFASAACPKRHALKLLDDDIDGNPKWCAVRDLLIEQASYANGFLVALLGQRGTGKTELATAVIYACTRRLISARYVKAKDLFRDIRRAYSPVARGERGEREDELVERWIKCDLLVVDEAHERAETDWEQGTFVNLLDRRYDDMACTIIIANQTKEQFAESMGDSVISRIHQTGEAIVCDWPSYRKPGNWKQAAGSLRRSSESSEKREQVYGEM